MKQIFNTMFLALKFMLLIFAFGISLYIVLSMYKRIDKNIIEAIPIFLPYIFLLFIFFMNITLGQKEVNDNLFYNLTCCLTFSCICLVGLRAILDKNMLLNSIMGYNINFSYFGDFIIFMKVLLYGLIISNFFFMIHSKKEKVEIAKKIELI